MLDISSGDELLSLRSSLPHLLHEFFLLLAVCSCNLLGRVLGQVDVVDVLHGLLHNLFLRLELGPPDLGCDGTVLGPDLGHRHEQYIQFQEVIYNLLYGLLLRGAQLVIEQSSMQPHRSFAPRSISPPPLVR